MQRIHETVSKSAQHRYSHSVSAWEMGAVLLSLLLSYKCSMINSLQPLGPNYVPSLGTKPPFALEEGKNQEFQTIYFVRINIFSSFEINTNQFERWGNQWEEGTGPSLFSTK